MKSPFSVRKAVTNLAIPWKLSLMVGFFCAGVCGLLFLSYVGMAILSSARAYVGGESLWSKGQKQAVFRLGRYAWSHSEQEFNEYSAAIQIPLGDHAARLALQKQPPDLDAAKDGFLRGGNDAEDIPGMIALFRRFHSVHYLAQAIAIWTEGDHLIEQLERIAADLHAEIQSGKPSESRLQRMVEEAQVVDSQLTPLENAFSATLGEGARWMKSMLLLTMVLATTFLLLATLIVAHLISKHLSEEIDQLRIGAARIAGGDYSFSLDTNAQDEIGDLARTFQEMARQRQHAEEFKDELLTNVARANQELEAFSYSVSHDLRAPLRAIDGFSQELIANCESQLDERGKGDLARIRSGAQRMGQLIDDLLQLSRLSRSELKRDVVDLSALVSEILKKFQSAEPHRNLRTRVVPNLVVQADPHLVQIALQNLLENAWKFTQKTPQATIEFGSLKIAGRETYFVRDNGVGFDMAYAGNLFKAFHRMHDGKDFPGTGIGLAIVQRIVDRHGGRIWAEAAENHGAKFFFTLN